VAEISSLEKYRKQVNCKKVKVTIDVPDELYRRVKARTALQGRAVRDVTIELFRKWVQESEECAQPQTGKSESWVDKLLNHAVPAIAPGPTAREILEQGRRRGEPR